MSPVHLTSADSITVCVWCHVLLVQHRLYATLHLLRIVCSAACVRCICFNNRSTDVPPGMEMNYSSASLHPSKGATGTRGRARFLVRRQDFHCQHPIPAPLAPSSSESHPSCRVLHPSSVVLRLLTRRPSRAQLRAFGSRIAWSDVRPSFP